MDELKTCLIDMLKWFHDFCEDHGIRYYLVEGTMLGAARHKGFIPWDDDIDVGVPRKDYDKLRTIMGDQIHDGRYLLETEDSGKTDYLYPFGKLYDVTTTLVESRRIVVKRGVCIDVFPLDGIGDDEKDAIKNYKPIGHKQDVLASRVVVIRKGRKWYKNLAVRMFQMLPSFCVNEKKLLKEITALCRLRDFDNSEYVGNLVSTYRKKEIMPRKYYGTPVLYDFEGIKVYGVEYSDAYLSTLYGDWKTYPPEGKRVSSHVRESIDLNKSFLE